MKVFRQRKAAGALAGILGLVATAAIAAGGPQAAQAVSGISTPSGVSVTYTGARSVTLSWSASTNNTGDGDAVAYYVYEGSNIVATSMGTNVTVSSLLPSTSYSFSVAGYDASGAQSSSSSSVSVTTTAAPAPSYYKTAYYDQWSVYGNAVYPSTLVQEGIPGKVTTLIYDFENIDPTNLTCFETIKSADTNDTDPNAGDGAGDAFADYQKSFTSSGSVDGTSDVYSQPIKGTFNQLRELKVKYPNLRIILSIGGWTYSKYFSQAAATAASRQKFVSSCLDMFIKGNLPTGVSGDPSGGPESAAGIFDGIDIDWEYPASAAGHTGKYTVPPIQPITRHCWQSFAASSTRTVPRSASISSLPPRCLQARTR